MNIAQLEKLEQESLQRGIPIIGREKVEWLLNKVKELQPGQVALIGPGHSGETGNRYQRANQGQRSWCKFSAQHDGSPSAQQMLRW